MSVRIPVKDHTDVLIQNVKRAFQPAIVWKRIYGRTRVRNHTNAQMEHVTKVSRHRVIC